MWDFDHDYVNGVIRRLAGLRADAQPPGDPMTAADMIRHLAETVRLSMGRAGAVTDRSSWLSRNLVAPLVLNGWLLAPSCRRLADVSPPRKSSAHDDVEGLHALLEEYLALVQAGELVPEPHPYLGAIGVDGWAKVHGLHFELHLRQFGV